MSVHYITPTEAPSCPKPGEKPPTLFLTNATCEFSGPLPTMRSRKKKRFISLLSRKSKIKGSSSGNRKAQNGKLSRPPTIQGIKKERKTTSANPIPTNKKHSGY